MRMRSVYTIEKLYAKSKGNTAQKKTAHRLQADGRKDINASNELAQFSTIQKAYRTIMEQMVSLDRMGINDTAVL